MPKAMQLVKANELKRMDWCARQVHLEHTHGLKEAPGIGLAEWIVWHDSFCKYKEGEFHYIREEYNDAVDTLKADLIEYARPTLGNIIKDSERKFYQFLSNDHRKNINLDISSESIHQKLAELTINVFSQLNFVATKRAPLVLAEASKYDDFRFSREYGRYVGSDVGVHGELSNYVLNILARPDFTIAAKLKGEPIYNILSYDVKPEEKEHFPGDRLQNIAGQLCIESNPAIVRKKLGLEKNQPVKMSETHQLFFYKSGEEVSYFVDAELGLTKKRIELLQKGDFPREKYEDDANENGKCIKCGVRDDCVRLDNLESK